MDLFNDFRDRNVYRGVPEPTAVLLGVFPYKKIFIFPSEGLRSCQWLLVCVKA